MIKITTIPQAAASATTQDLLIEITEKCCKPYCTGSALKPSASVAFTTGSVQVLGEVAIVPITATVTIVTPSSSGCGCAHTQVLTESFEIGFTATTANTITLTNMGSETEPADITCCKARSVKVTSVLDVVIS